jgi:hypothetical protein
MDSLGKALDFFVGQSALDTTVVKFYGTLPPGRYSGQTQICQCCYNDFFHSFSSFGITKELSNDAADPHIAFFENRWG